MFQVRLLCLVAVLLAAPVRAAADDPDAHDVGTKVCRDVQIASAAVASDDPGHPQARRGILRVVLPFVREGAITSVCARCIVGQLARSSPLAEEPCGPDRICGDGELDPAEECDDGNLEDGDGCSRGCAIEDLCGGLIGLPCAPNEYCEFAPGACGRDGKSGVCTDLGDCGCPRVLDPVCGCDGRTYSNDCNRQCAGTSLAHRGECTHREVCGRAGLCPEGSVCCNPLLGICTPPGTPCIQ